MSVSIPFRIFSLAATIVVATMFIARPSIADAGTSTSNMTVQMQVTASCTINAATLDFGTSAGNNLLTSNVDASTTVSVTCTNGSPFSIGMDNGSNVTGAQRRLKNGAANYLNYNLFTDSSRTNAWTTATSNSTCATSGSCALGTGTGSAQAVSIYGRIPTVASAPTPGVYTDTVVMTITY